MTLVLQESQDHPHDFGGRSVDLLVLVGHEGCEGGVEPLFFNGSCRVRVIGRQMIRHHHSQQLYAGSVGFDVRAGVAEVVEHHSVRDETGERREERGRAC